MSQVLLESTHSLNRGDSANTIDIRVGGQQGLLPDFANWANNANLVKQRLIPVLLQAPGGMQYQPDGASRIAMLKAMIELHPIAISGLNRSLTAEFAETVVSNAGEMMETVTKTTRERSVPALTIPEKEGKPCTHLIEDWIIDLLMDPQTGYPGVIRYAAYEEAGSPPISPDFRSMVVLFIEPNATMSGVNAAYLCVNMMPKGVTDESSSAIGEALEEVNLELEFTALTQTGDAVNKLALNYLKSLDKRGLAPAALQSFVPGIAANVADDAVPLGNAVAVKAVAASLG